MEAPEARVRDRQNRRAVQMARPPTLRVGGNAQNGEYQIIISNISLFSVQNASNKIILSLRKEIAEGHVS